MSEFTTHSERRLVGRSLDRRGLLAAAQRLFAQRGRDVTLSEIAVEAGIDAGNSGCAGLVESVRTQRLGDLIDHVRGLLEPEVQQVGAAFQPVAGWTESVREILSAHLERPGLSLHAVARMLAVSPRTLQRRLAEEGTSWRRELDAVRYARATALLREGATSDATAERLGYSGSRALRRALRRWSRARVSNQVLGFSPTPPPECRAG
jgi:AraC-like DNA-binding protein